MVQVVERDERDVEEVGPASGVAKQQRGDLRLNLGRRLGHDGEGVPGAHGSVAYIVMAAMKRSPKFTFQNASTLTV